jgi:glyoxylase-like metal-dependent hydrolase (beta-lactamase superfamily II)
MKPEITLVYDADCPNVDAARAALGEAIARARLDLGWIERERRASDVPQRTSRFGSPTILVNGEDVAGEPGADAACCRIYQTPHGLRGVPSVETITAAIERASLLKSVPGARMTKTTASGALGLAFVSALGWLCCLPIAAGASGVALVGIAAVVGPWWPVLTAGSLMLLTVTVVQAVRGRGGLNSDHREVRKHGRRQWLILSVVGLLTVALLTLPWWSAELTYLVIRSRLTTNRSTSMCITHRFPSRRELMRLAALGIPALALGSRTVRAFAASGAGGSPGDDCSRGRALNSRLPALRVGDVKISRVVETEGPMMTLSSFFIDGVSGAQLPDAAVEAHRTWLDKWALASDGTMIFSIQSLLVATPRHRILVDTCLGGGADETADAGDLSKIAYFQKLRSAGVKPEEIDFVLCTHLHVDHVGWNTYRHDGKVVPTFPEAKYVIARPEWDYWRQRKKGDFGYESIDYSVHPLVEAKRVLLVDPPYQLDNETRIEPIYGHTPGQVALRISSAGQSAILAGDVLHHPVQCAEPQWESIYTVDREHAMATRRAFLERNAASDVLVNPAHFPTPGVGRIVSHGSAWRFERTA